jgi:hypothetical protein
MTSTDSVENQKICVELANSDANNLKSSVYKVERLIRTIREKNNTLDNWIMKENNKYIDDQQYEEYYEMPRRLDWEAFKKSYDVRPQNYEQLISIPGIGPAAVRALSLIGELIYGTKAFWQDPVKFNFAHGGKDGVPYPVARKTYDKSKVIFLLQLKELK